MKKVLIVDDDELILDLLSEFLSQHGFSVYIASNVSVGYEKYCEQEPDIVLSDVIMEEETGFDLYEKIKMLNPNVKFIFMTGYEYDNNIIQKIESFGNKWIAKPIKFDDLLELIESEW